MRDIPREIADKYQGLFDLLNQEHDLILTIEEMDEIILEVQKLVENFSIAPVSNCLHPDNNIVSDLDGLFCMECREYIKEE